MAIVRKRTWKTVHGTTKAAWLVDYRDRMGHRRFQTFARKEDADDKCAEIIARMMKPGPRHANMRRQLIAELTAHVGGAPTVAQKLLIDRIVITRVLLDQLDEKLFVGVLTGNDRRDFFALQNGLARMLARLDLPLVGPAAPLPVDTLANHLQRRGTG